MTAGSRSILSIPIAILLILFCCAGQAVAQAEAAVAAGTRRALTREGKAIEVRPLDAWDNPYRGQYGEWDYWVWEHFDPALTFTDLGS